MIDLVGKIGSMALIDAKNGDIDYNKFAALGKQLKPGMVWISSGAVEIGRLDFFKRAGAGLTGCVEENKTDYAAQGQAILMQTYRNFIDPKFSIRQILVEHSHFNDDEKRAHIEGLIKRAAAQGAIPIINYNDAVSSEENRKFEIDALRKKNVNAHELVDNDETAAQIACLVKAKTLLILSTLDGIYADIKDPKSLIREISGKSTDEVHKKIDVLKMNCKGASRAGAGGAAAKLEYIKPCLARGTRVIIACAAYGIDDVLAGRVPSTAIFCTDN